MSTFYENNIEKNKIYRAVLVGLDTDSSEDFEHSISEMESLIEACDMEVAGILTQKLAHPEAGT